MFTEDFKLQSGEHTYQEWATKYEKGLNKDISPTTKNLCSILKSKLDKTEVDGVCENLNNVRFNSEPDNESSPESKSESASAIASPKQPLLVFIFDEAQGLFDNDLYAHMKAALELFPQVVGVFLSTNANLFDLYSPTVNTVSLRAVVNNGKKSVLPLIFDLPYSDLDCEKNLNVRDHYLLRGRPLWDVGGK